MRGSDQMTTFLTLIHSIGNVWLLSGVQCPFYLSLVDSVCVRRDSADSLNDYVQFDTLLSSKFNPFDHHRRS